MPRATSFGQSAGSLKTRLSKKDWLKAALEVLVHSGEAAMTIDNVSKRLNVTKGSFYAHFSDRKQFETELVNHWVDEFTASFIAELDKLKGGAPEDRLAKLLELIHTVGQHNNDITFHVWAMRNPAIAEDVYRADRRRFEAVKEIFYDIGFHGAELEMRTRIFLAYHSLQHNIDTPPPTSGWDTERKLTFDFFLKK